VHHACVVLKTALATLPVKDARDLRLRIVGARAGRQLPVLGIPSPARVMPQERLPAPLSATDLTVEWHLGHAGSADCEIADERSAVVLHLGYCTDALRDLLAETASVTGGRAAVGRFSFDAEPTEYRWMLRAHRDGIEVCIRRFAAFGDPEWSGELVWRSCQPPARLASVVAGAAQRVLDAHGEDGYRRRWMLHPFPINELRELQRLAG
jgi:hypothetical protein